VSELHEFDAWLGQLLSRLEPAGRRSALRAVARDLRRSQAQRIARQKSPDGSAYEPRKKRSAAQLRREKKGGIKRAAMFAKIRQARHLQMETSANSVAVGFAGRVARIARVHQEGQRMELGPHGPTSKLPKRVLIGITNTEREAIRTALLAHLTRD
jgi:phage virion morphogenesis protein